MRTSLTHRIIEVFYGGLLEVLLDTKPNLLICAGHFFEFFPVGASDQYVLHFDNLNHNRFYSLS